MITIDHKMPTSAQMRERIRDALARGEPLGVSHVPKIEPLILCNGSLNYRPPYSEGSS